MPIYFKLDVELGNAAMRSPAHLANALKRVSDRIRLHEIHEGESGKIRDINGNTVGSWVFYKDGPKEGT